MTHTVMLTPTQAVVDGKVLATQNQGGELLTELYRSHVGEYPKFFKMDPLSKVGFIAAELLLQAEHPGTVEQRCCYNTDHRGILLFNRAGSVGADTLYQATIQDPENFYPSPALFVYTLPNIVTGEIAIRNKYFGETNFMVLDHYDEAIIRQQSDAAFLDPQTESLLCGWVDCTDRDTFEARLSIINK